jgi:hypothetical protein
MFHFQEIGKEIIYIMYNENYFDDARYFSITKNKKPVCIYGVITRSDDTAEVLWIVDSFRKDGFTKELFINLFNHFSALGFKRFYSWTRCKKLTNILNNFKKYGIEKTDYPFWDSDETKTWFMKRI